MFHCVGAVHIPLACGSLQDKTTVGLGSLPPEYRHMHSEMAPGEDQSENLVQKLRYHCMSSLEDTVFVQETRAACQGIKRKSGDLEYMIRCWEIIGTAIQEISRTRLGFGGGSVNYVSRLNATICTSIESLAVPMQG